MVALAIVVLDGVVRVALKEPVVALPGKREALKDSLGSLGRCAGTMNPSVVENLVDVGELTVTC